MTSVTRLRCAAFCFPLVVLTLFGIVWKTYPLDTQFLGSVDQPDPYQSWRPRRPPKPAWEPKKVLLFTYSRSGSSFTGDVISHSPDVYFVYEPLRALSFSFRKTSNQATTNTLSPLKRQERLLQDWFNCNFTSELLENTDRKFTSRYQATTSLYRCFRLPTNSTRFLSCAKEAEKVCQGHKTVVVKEIRYSLTSVAKMMTLNPDLGIIFLVRDPRGAIWSRMNVFDSPDYSHLRNYAADACQRVLSDTMLLRELFRRAPHKVRFLRYEDLAHRPLEVSRNIYTFLRLTWSDAVRAAILKQTSSSGGEGGQKQSTGAGGRNNTTGSSKRRRSNRRRRGAEDNNTHLDPYSPSKTDAYISAMGSSRRRVRRRRSAEDSNTHPSKADAYDANIGSSTRRRRGGRRRRRSAEDRKTRLDPYSLTRPDAYQAAMGWRRSIPLNVSRVTEDECGDVMHVLGYVTLPSLHELRGRGGGGGGGKGGRRSEGEAVANRGRFRLADDLAETFPGVDLGQVDSGSTFGVERTG